MRRDVGLVLSGIGGVLALVVGSNVFVRMAAREWCFSAGTVPERPVGLVLGAQVYPDGRPSPFLAARLDLAVQLLESDKITAVIVSGDHLAPEYNEPEAMRTYLISRGVDETKIISDGQGLDTYDSCHRAQRVFGIRALTVLTQTYHLPRAVATARALGLDAVGVGDESVRPGSRSWRRGRRREVLACVKTVVDLVSRRDATAGERSTSVLRAADSG